jgi:hypothetical protein
MTADIVKAKEKAAKRNDDISKFRKRSEKR